MDKIKIAIVGVGNCASSLLQGIEYYKNKDSKEAIGLMHWDIGGYTKGGPVAACQLNHLFRDIYPNNIEMWE